MGEGVMTGGGHHDQSSIQRGRSELFKQIEEIFFILDI